VRLDCWLSSLGSFWALLKLADALWATQPAEWNFVGNAITAFSLTREFALILRSTEQMTVRSPEVHCVALPMMILMGFNLHVPLVLQACHYCQTGQM